VGAAACTCSVARIVQAERLAMPIADLQDALEELAGIRATPDAQEIDELNEQAGLALARPSHDLDQLPQPRQKTIVTDAQQWAAGNVANAGRLDHDDRR